MREAGRGGATRDGADDGRRRGRGQADSRAGGASRYSGRARCPEDAPYAHAAPGRLRRSRRCRAGAAVPPVKFVRLRGPTAERTSREGPAGRAGASRRQPSGCGGCDGAGCGPFTDGRTVAPEAARASTHTDTTAPIAGCGRNKSPRSLTDYNADYVGLEHLVWK